MLVDDLVKELKKWRKKFGNIEVDVFHNGLYYPSNEIVMVTMPDNRRVIQIVTVPVNWYDHFSDKEKENVDKGTTR